MGEAWIAWLGAAVVLGVLEVTTVNLVFAMLAGGALAGAIAAGLSAGLPVQLLVAAVVAVLLLTLVRPPVLRRIVRNRRTEPMGARALVGRTATVVDPVTPGGGRIDLGGDLWSACTIQDVRLRPGTQVRVVAIEGATAVVRRVAEPGPGGSDRPFDDASDGDGPGAAPRDAV